MASLDEMDEKDGIDVVEDEYASALARGSTDDAFTFPELHADFSNSGNPIADEDVLH